MYIVRKIQDVMMIIDALIGTDNIEFCAAESAVCLSPNEQADAKSKAPANADMADGFSDERKT
jgi:hypothetical protein